MTKYRYDNRMPWLTTAAYVLATLLTLDHEISFIIGTFGAFAPLFHAVGAMLHDHTLNQNWRNVCNANGWKVR